MAHQLEKNYSAFAGVDTRSNKLMQNPKAFRRGSKNFRYNFQDEIQNANGFQHKDSGAPSFVDIFEYKYRDVDTGKSQTQILGVATDGLLYRKLNATLSFNSHGAATSVSIYYDEVADAFKCVLAGLGTVNISDTMTLAQLETALELLAGVTVTITGTSTTKAYLLDCVIDDTSFADNVAYYWEPVPYPGSSVPFGIAAANYNKDDYEGISAVNLNNSIYITDGGFPFKYDGKAVYRAGMPKTPQAEYDDKNYNGCVFTPQSGAGFSEGEHFLLLSLRFRDQNGFTVYGKPQAISPYYAKSGGGALYGGQYFNFNSTDKKLKIEVKHLKYGDNFPVFSCKINNISGFALTGAGPFILDVLSGHNIVPGMCLRLNYTTTADSTTFTPTTYVFYALVSSVSSTTITLSTAIPSGTITLVDQTLIQGCYVPASMVGKNQASILAYDFEQSGDWYGVSYVLYSTKTNTAYNSTYYEVAYFPVPHNSAHESDIKIDPGVETSFIIPFDPNIGSELPRACKYLSEWQGLLVQSGRPYDESLGSSYYPTIYNPPHASGEPPTGVTKIRTQADINFDTYTEAHLCDFQSIYWADALSPEGFPQDGLHEIAIDTVHADQTKGMIKNKDAFFVFKERSTALLVGTLATNDVQIEILEADCGCVSHKSIKEVRGTVVWLDRYNGFYSCVAGRLPQNIGFPIQDYTKINALGLNFTKASATNYRKESLYVCSVGTTTFVFDYCNDGSLTRDCWYIWDRINGKSVLATSDDILLINDGTNTWKMKLTKTKYDMTDHKSAIPMVLNTSWSHGMAPTIDKHYIGLWINSIQGDFTLTVKQYGNYLEDLIGTQSNVSFIAESMFKKAIKAQVKAAIPKLSSISFGMENAEKNKLVRIQGFEIQLSNDFDSGEPKK